MDSEGFCVGRLIRTDRGGHRKESGSVIKSFWIKTEGRVRC